MTSLNKANPRILVIDDDPKIRSAFQEVLTPKKLDTRSIDALSADLFDEEVQSADDNSFDLDTAPQGQDGYELVKRSMAEGRPYGMAFVDMRMPPGWDGLETIEHLWKADPGLEVVICTAFSDYSWEDIIKRLGRTHRLLLLRKPFDKAEVWQLAAAQARKRATEIAALLHQTELASANKRLEEEIRARASAEDRLKHDALHDSLTDLPNRMLLTERLERCIERARRTPDYQYAILFMDLDDFKLINDTLGHTVGDHLLIEVSKRIKNSLRSLDTASRNEDETPARLGGDEFVVLLDGLKLAEDAQIVAERVRAAVSQPLTVAGHEIVVTTSIGIAYGRPDYTVPDDILRDADAALYHCKAAGKGRVGLFDDAIRKQVMDRLRIGNDLRKAIALNQLRLVYQPIVSLTSGRIESLEALVRWDHPELGAVSPMQFIPVAEETGAIHEIGRWVLEEGCRQLSIWHEQFPDRKDLSISVNASAKQLALPDFANVVRRTLANCGLQGKHLNIELTETALMENTKPIVELITQLHEMGVRLHLDDFGTGFSSLSYLHQLPFDAIKIDRSFVKDMNLDGKHANTIMAIQRMADNRGMQVIAEGIEIIEHLASLQTLDCNSGQGYYISRPIAAGSVKGLLAQTDSPRWHDPEPAPEPKPNVA